MSITVKYVVRKQRESDYLTNTVPTSTIYRTNQNQDCSRKSSKENSAQELYNVDLAQLTEMLIPSINRVSGSIAAPRHTDFYSC